MIVASPLGQASCPPGHRYDQIEQQCVPMTLPVMELAPVRLAPTPTPAPPGPVACPEGMTAIIQADGSVTCVMTAPPIAPGAVTLPPPVQVAPEEREGWKWWHWLLLGLGVAGTGGLIYYGVKRR